MLIFLLFSDQISWGEAPRGQTASGGAPPAPSVEESQNEPCHSEMYESEVSNSESKYFLPFDRSPISFHFKNLFK